MMAKRPREEVRVYVGELVDAADDLLSNSGASVGALADGNTYKAMVLNVQIIGESLRAMREHHPSWFAQNSTQDWLDVIETRHQISHHFASMTPQALHRMLSAGQIQRIREQALAAL